MYQFTNFLPIDSFKPLFEGKASLHAAISVHGCRDSPSNVRWVGIAHRHSGCYKDKHTVTGKDVHTNSKYSTTATALLNSNVRWVRIAHRHIGRCKDKHTVRLVRTNTKLILIGLS